MTVVSPMAKEAVQLPEELFVRVDLGIHLQVGWQAEAQHVMWSAPQRA